MEGNAFNLARRLSVRNEPDLLQEDMTASSAGGDNGGTTTDPFSAKSCFAMLSKVCPNHPLPVECQRYSDVTAALRRRNSDRTNHFIAFQGMGAGAASDAMAARERGDLNAYQLTRRLTKNGHPTPQSDMA